MLPFSDETYAYLTRTASGGGVCGSHWAFLCTTSSCIQFVPCVADGVRCDFPVPVVTVSWRDVLICFDYAQQGPLRRPIMSPRWSVGISGSCSNTLTYSCGGAPDSTTCTDDGLEFSDHMQFMGAPSPFPMPTFHVECGACCVETLPFGFARPGLDDLLGFSYREELSVNSDYEAEVLEAADMLLADEACNLCLERMVRSMDAEHYLDPAALARWCLLPRFRGAGCCAHEHIDQFEAGPLANRLLD